MLVLAPSLADLPFRGDRNYLHSTDLYPALTVFAQRQFSPDAFIESLTIRQAVSHQVSISLDGPQDAFGSFRVRYGTTCTKGWLIETDKCVSSRIPFDEATAMQAAVNGPGFALYQKLLPQYSVFELMLILTKIVSSQESQEHWWLCQIEFHSRLREVVPLECRLHRKVLQRYITFQIYQDRQAIGVVTGISGAVSDLSVKEGHS